MIPWEQVALVSGALAAVSALLTAWRVPKMVRWLVRRVAQITVDAITREVSTELDEIREAIVPRTEILQRLDALSEELRDHMADETEQREREARELAGSLGALTSQVEQLSVTVAQMVEQRA